MQTDINADLVDVIVDDPTEIDIANFNEIIKVNKLEEIKNSSYLINNQPTEDGLFSYQIFGKPGSTKRKFQWAYIDLQKKFLHPLVYDALYKTDRKLPDLIKGEVFAKLDTETGELKYVDSANESQAGVFTGIQGFYENFKKMKFRRGDSKGRHDNLAFIRSLDIDQIFIDKFLVIPPFYRDIDLSAGNTMSTDEVSDIYKKVISLSKQFDKNSSSLIFVGYNTEWAIQDSLNELYAMLTKKNSKKNGYIRKSLLGKNVDYSARGVISSAKMATNTSADQLVHFGEIGVPLHMILTSFLPFVMFQLQNRFFSSYRDGSLVIYNANSDKLDKIDEISIEEFSSKNFEKLINIYARSKEDRLNKLYIKNSKGEEIPFIPFPDLHKGTSNKDSKRARDRNIVPGTITDLLFHAARFAIEDKYVYMTRYPIEDYLNITPVKPVIVTTRNTIELGLNITDSGKSNIVSHIVVRDYPYVEDKKKVEWIDSCIPHYSYLPALGGDFDFLIWLG